jgi:hypothetical protein
VSLSLVTAYSYEADYAHGGKRRPTDAQTRAAVNDLKDALKAAPCASAKTLAKAKAAIKLLNCDIKEPPGYFCSE